MLKTELTSTFDRIPLYGALVDTGGLSMLY